jgi:phosphatidylserine/phosphatidylglycerophosphate/cardiolipin synthase-like enzyme
MKQAPTRVAVVCIAGVANQYDGTAWVDTVSDIYPHAKTMVVDDTWAYIGSANANGRSFRLDGEIGYVIRDRAVVTTYRKALWKEHLDVDVETRDIRKFMDDTWKAKIIKGKAKPADCSQAELQNVHAVELTDPPKGQKYNGPGSFLVTIDDYL